MDDLITPLMLHHIGVLVEDIEASCADFASRLGYVIETDTVVDPIQTAHVRFLRQPQGACWLELVCPDGPGSKLSNRLRSGGGLHHLCYEVDDMDETCRRLRDQEMLMVGAPTPAAAFGGRRIAWFMDRKGILLELLESGDGPLSLASRAHGRERPT